MSFHFSFFPGTGCRCQHGILPCWHLILGPCFNILNCLVFSPLLLMLLLLFLLFVSSYAFALLSEGTAQRIVICTQRFQPVFAHQHNILFFHTSNLKPRIFNHLQTVLWEMMVSPYCLRSLYHFDT
jgi:hypothetical protein